MRHRPSSRGYAGFTLVEVLVGMTIGVLVSLGVFAFIDTSSMLTARNLSVNLTSDSIRGSLDRVEQLIQSANTMPVLINTSGTSSAGPAAGVRFDRYIGGTYVVNPPATTLASGLSSLSLVFSTSSVSSAVNPTQGDILRIDGSVATLRPKVGAPPFTTSIPALGQRSVTVSLTSSLGTAVSSSSGIRAKLIRDVAVIVMPSGSGRQLRYYSDFGATTDLNDVTKYVVLTDQVGLQAIDATPFSLQSIGGKSFVKMSLRVRASNFDRRLSGKQADQFNTFSQVDIFTRPKIE